MMLLDWALFKKKKSIICSHSNRFPGWNYTIPAFLLAFRSVQSPPTFLTINNQQALPSHPHKCWPHISGLGMWQLSCWQVHRAKWAWARWGCAGHTDITSPAQVPPPRGCSSRCNPRPVPVLTVHRLYWESWEHWGQAPAKGWEHCQNNYRSRTEAWFPDVKHCCIN